MKIEIEVYDIPKDKHGLYEYSEEMYNSIPIIVFDDDDGTAEYVDEYNWDDWCSDFNKPRYKHYIRLKDLKDQKHGDSVPSVGTHD